MRVIPQATLGVAVTLASVMGAALPAAAATPTAAHQETVLSAASCKKSIKAWGFQGYYKCGTQVSKVDWNRDGRTDEVFVIAPNRTIWHVWKNAGGWKVMPGNGRADDMMGPNSTGDPRRCILVYVNRGYHYWQNCFYSGKWHSWTTAG
ncbi:hypothetical protein [Streptomyces sp. NPDC046939]|uniref:hypothetical protein n=1 Tax=Streptomyces sp. NPDC046939 TaxID=3155376 RepID=UPI0033C19B66